MTETYNPIIAKEELGSRLFAKRPVPDAQTSIVLSGDGKNLLIIEQGQKSITAGEMLFGKYRTLYKVDMTEHPLSFECALPGQGDAFEFHAKINFFCAVRDAGMIVQRGVTDVLAHLEHIITDVMRNISRLYEVDQISEAERVIGDRVRETINDQGFRSDRLTVKLSLEEEARNWLRKRKEIEEHTKTEQLSLRSQIEIEQQQQKLARQQQEQQMELERERQRQQMELDRERQQKMELDREKQQKMELERERQRQQMELERQRQQMEQERERQKFEMEQERERQKFEIEKEEMEMKLLKMRMEFYGPLIQSGSWQLLALQLAKNPKDTESVLALIMQQQQIERSHQINMLQLLLKEDALEGTQVAEIGKRFLQSLTGNSGSLLPVSENRGSISSESISTEKDDEKLESSGKNSARFDYNEDEG